MAFPAAERNLCAAQPLMRMRCGLVLAWMRSGGTAVQAAACPGLLLTASASSASCPGRQPRQEQLGEGISSILPQNMPSLATAGLGTARAGRPLGEGSGVLSENIPGAGRLRAAPPGVLAVRLCRQLEARAGSGSRTTCFLQTWPKSQLQEAPPPMGIYTSDARR